MRAPSIVALLFVAALSGCSALDRVNDALYATGGFDVEPSSARVAASCAVTVIAGDRRGRGVIVGRTTVLTVAHVVGANTDVEIATSSLRWTRAHVVRRVASAPEDLVLLEVETSASSLGFAGFEDDRAARKGEGSPSVVLAASGAHGWSHADALRPGDSGSPVLDGEGALIGLLVGKTRQGTGVLAPLTAPHATPRDATPEPATTVVAQLSATR